MLPLSKTVTIDKNSIKDEVYFYYYLAKLYISSLILDSDTIGSVESQGWAAVLREVPGVRDLDVVDAIEDRFDHERLHIADGMADSGEQLNVVEEVAGNEEGDGEKESRGRGDGVGLQDLTFSHGEDSVSTTPEITTDPSLRPRLVLKLPARRIRKRPGVNSDVDASGGLLNDCFCGQVVLSNSEGSIECKKPGCETIWVS